jgi:MoxR-like ATPase
MITIILFMIFTAKRRQRVIPVVHEPANKSLEFTELIGTLYFQKKDHADLVRKKFSYLAEELRREIQVDIEEVADDERSFHRIARKTGMDAGEIAKFIREVRPVIYGGRVIDAEQMKVQELKDRIASVIVGQEQTVDLVLTAILANGHVLIEGVPGVAKTLLARLTARLIDADFSRVQFTPDLMPSDVLGTTVFNMKTNGFDFHQGPIFADIVLVDEINRAPAKTQAALFEVMEERQISIDGTTHRMGDLYTILATQNPVEQEGTYKLPEAQLDRFLMKITMDYPSLEEEVNILERHHTNAALVKLDDIVPAITKEELLSLRAFMNQVFVDRTLLQYIALIVQQTRTSKAVYLGASPRASVAMLQSSKAYALLQGRDFVTPEDIKFVAPYVLQHRLILTAEAEMEGYSPVKVTQRLIDKVEVPK